MMRNSRTSAAAMAAMMLAAGLSHVVREPVYSSGTATRRREGIEDIERDKRNAARSQDERERNAWNDEVDRKKTERQRARNAKKWGM